MEFANISGLMFEPGDTDALALDGSTGNIYTTPAGNKVTLRDLARLSYAKATLKYRIRLSAADSAGEVTVAVKQGASVQGSEQVSFDGSTEYAGNFEVDVSDISGSAKLELDINLDTLAGAGITATVAAVLEVEHPIVVGTCG